jgi:hypothetical protein
MKVSSKTLKFQNGIFRQRIQKWRRNEKINSPTREDVSQGLADYLNAGGEITELESSPTKTDSIYKFYIEKGEGFGNLY